MKKLLLIILLLGSFKCFSQTFSPGLDASGNVVGPTNLFIPKELTIIGNFSFASNAILSWSSNSIAGTSNIEFSVYRIGTNQLALTNGQPIRLRWYLNTSEYTEIGHIANIFHLMNNATRSIRLGANAIARWELDGTTFQWQPSADNVYDFGSTTRRPKTTYLASNIVYNLSTIAGTGNGNTNYTLIALSREMFMGSSNVNILAAMQGISGSVIQWRASITNDSVDTWGILFSSVTNRWFFKSLETGVTNAPSVLTNNTRLVLEGKQEGTNVEVKYYYLRPAK